MQDVVAAHDGLDGRAPSGAGVEVSDLTWRPYGRSRPVLEHLDLRIEPGERVLLAGPSGSGKSTLLRAVAGLLLTADSGDLHGTISVDGVAPQQVPGAVGLVLQDPGAGIVASTVGRDVAFGLENVSTVPGSMPQRVAAALAEVGLSMSSDSPPSTLSGGESQRLALAGALVMEPSVLLLDEPTAMLDASTAADVRAVVAEVVARRGLTLVVVEHRLEGWLELVDRLVVLDAHGAVVADGQPHEVLRTRGESLAAQGIWVPGVPDPQPMALSLPEASAGSAATSAVVPRGRVVVSARDLDVEHRSRRLGEPARSTMAVADADVDVCAGEMLAIVGPSGAGKSTLMAAVGGLVAPTRGAVEMALPLTPGEGAPGEASGRRRPARNRLVPPSEWRARDLARVVSWVPQRAASAIVGRTVRDDILATPRALGLDQPPTPAGSGDRTSGGDSAPARVAETGLPVSRPVAVPSGVVGGVVGARVDALLEALGLTHLADADPRQLSGGEQRRLAMASAIAHSPALVLADEPTVGQDRLTWAAVTGVLDAARREGSAVVVTTHDPGVVARADRVVALTQPEQPPADPEPERRPLLARVGPLALLLAALSVLPLPALLSSWRQGLAVLGVEIVLAVVGLAAPGRGRRPQGRLRGVLARLAPAAIAVAGVAWSAWLLGGHDVEVAAGAALRVLCLIVPSAVVVGFIDPERLGDHLAQRVRLPARPVVAATAALQRLQAFDALWAELMTTRRVRGIRADTGVVARTRETVVVTGGLLVGALGQASNLALAMDARGFAEARRRTWAGDAPWRMPDTLAVLAGLVIIASGVAARLFLP